MAWELGIGGPYYILATVFQFSLAAIILSTDRRDAVRIGFAVLLALGGLETLSFGLAPVGDNVYPDPAMRVIDTVLLYTIAFLATQFPTSIGGQRGRRWAIRAWIGVSSAVVVLFATIHALNPGVYDALGPVHELPFALAAAAIAVHLVPRWLELDRGPLRTQTMYAGAALAMSAAFLAGTRLHLITDPVALGSRLASNLNTGPDLAVIWFIGVALARLGQRVLDDGDRQAVAFTSLVAIAVLVGIRVRVGSTDAADEFATQVGRPLLIGIAMLRYDLVRIPERWRKLSLPAAAVVVLVLTFLTLVSIFMPEGLDAPMIDPMAAVAGLGLLAGLGVAGHRWLRYTFFIPVDEGPGDLDRLARYRLALERARAGGDVPGSAVQRLRGDLGISDDEHQILAALLDGHQLVPTSALSGAEAGDLIGQRYEVSRELGRGGQGRALLAWDRERERQVVLKEVLRPWEERADERRRRVRRTAQLLEGVDHANLAEVVGLVEEPQRTYLVREYVPGRTLDAVLAEDGPLDPNRVAAIVRGLAAGLAELHRRDLLHLDLKPTNVVLTDAGRPVLIDQGTVQRVAGKGVQANTQTLAGSGTEVGTLAWMSPEQVAGTPIDERSDVFALGALTYWLATGRTHVPIEGEAPYKVQEAIVRGAPPTDTPEPFADAIEQALAREPDRRPRSTTAFAALLGEGDAPLPDGSTPEHEEAAAHTDHVARR